MIGDISLVHADPKTEPGGEPLPLLHVPPDALLAFVDKRLDAEGFDVGLRMDAQLLADLDFDRQAVRVPAGFPFAEIAAHRAIAGEQVLDGPGEAVARMGQPVGGGGPFVEDEFWAAGPLGERFIVNAGLFPEPRDLGLEGRKIHIAFDRTEHERFAAQASRSGSFGQGQFSTGEREQARGERGEAMRDCGATGGDDRSGERRCCRTSPGRQAEGCRPQPSGQGLVAEEDAALARSSLTLCP